MEKELESYGELLKNADILGLELMESCVPQDVPKLQQMIDEYQLLWKDITKRMSALIEICKEECRKQQVCICDHIDFNIYFTVYTENC